MRPELTPGFDFINYIGPGSVTICEEAKEGIAYILWHFNCRWDPEHGFEVITHKDRVIDLSPDVDMDAMYKDNGTYEQYEAEYGNRVGTPPKKKKKWWQFWN